MICRKVTDLYSTGMYIRDYIIVAKNSSRL